MEKFVASVQYNDWTGTCAADDADDVTLRRQLIDEGLMSDDDAIVGVSVWVGENHGGTIQLASVSVLLVPLDEMNARLSKHPVRVRRVEKEMPLVDVIGLFKRFEFAMALRNSEIKHFVVE